MTLFLIPTILAPETQENVLPPQIKEVVGELNVFFCRRTPHGTPFY